MILKAKEVGMLPDEIKISFTINPKLWLVSPLAVAVFIGMFYLPWGAESAPAWAQAIGSVGAIVAAFLIANHQHKAEERTRRADAHERNHGYAARLAFFALEVEQVMSKVVLSSSRQATFTGDAKTADVLEVILQRLNQSFDDDLDATRVSFCFQLRMLLSGCIFTLQATRSLSGLERDSQIEQYKKTSKQIFDDCTAHAKAVYNAG